MGVVAAALAGKQQLVGMFVGEADAKLIAVTSKGGGKALKFDAAGRRGRAARGSTIVKLKDGETIQRLVPMQPQFNLPPEPEPAPARAKIKANGNGRHAPVTKKRAAAKKASPPKTKPAAKNGKNAKKKGRRK